MAKRKKHTKLPNGYGQIRYLGKGRRNPYGVYPPASEEYDNGQKKPPKALCYVNDWMIGFAVLTAYKAGTYAPGMEKGLAELSTVGTDQELINRILADYNRTKTVQQDSETPPTFAEVYDKFFDWKFNGKKKYGKSSINSSLAGFKNCSAIHNIPIDKIKYDDMQAILDSSTLKHSSLELMHSCMKQVCKFALAQGLISINPTDLLKININDDDEHGIPFTDNELKILWEHKNEDFAQLILIMCYSGYRVGELKVIDVDLENNCFSGGLKTKTSKERIVPMHSTIIDVIKERFKKDGCLMKITYSALRKSLKPYLSEIGIGEHTAHDCRHTFSRLCEKYNVRENDRKRMLGHKIGDLTNDVYGHRSLQELRNEIEKIPNPTLL